VCGPGWVTTGTDGGPFPGPCGAGAFADTRMRGGRRPGRTDFYPKPTCRTSDFFDDQDSWKFLPGRPTEKIVVRVVGTART